MLTDFNNNNEKKNNNNNNFQVIISYNHDLYLMPLWHIQKLTFIISESGHYEYTEITYFWGQNLAADDMLIQDPNQIEWNSLVQNYCKICKLVYCWETSAPGPVHSVLCWTTELLQQIILTSLTTAYALTQNLEWFRKLKRSSIK